MTIEAMRIEAMELALEALENNDYPQWAIQEMRQAIDQAELVAGQPLPCLFCGHVGLDFSDGNTYRWGIASCGGCGASCGEIFREYPDEGKWHSEAIAEWNKRTAPSPRLPWVGLTDEEINAEWVLTPQNDKAEGVWFGRRIEAKLKEKNT